LNLTVMCKGWTGCRGVHRDSDRHPGAATWVQWFTQSHEGRKLEPRRRYQQDTTGQCSGVWFLYCIHKKFKK